MKKAFSLIEVLIAVTLLSVVIVVILKMQQNNLFFLEKFKVLAKNDEYISIATLEENKTKSLKSHNVYLDEIVKFKDDEVRKKLKEIKVSIKESEKEEESFSTDQYQLIIKQYETRYTIDSQASKTFYRFVLEIE